MADKIPLNAHFIWVGNAIPHKQAQLIMSWAITQRKYTVTVWTNRTLENANVLKDMVALFPQILGGASATGDAKVATFKFTVKATEAKAKVHFLNVDILNGCLGQKLRARYDDEIANRNYGAASDILRIAALQFMGGVYADTDTDAVKELPPLSAADGILLGRFGNRGFCNAVLAAPAGHKYLTQIAEAMNSDYNYWEQKGLLAQYRAGVNAARLKVASARTDELARQQEAHRAKQAALGRKPLPAVPVMASVPPVPKPAPKHGKLVVPGPKPGPPPIPPKPFKPDEYLVSEAVKAAKTKLQEQMSSGSLLITGPTRLSLWLYMHIGGAWDPLRWMNAKGLLSDKTTNLNLAQYVAMFQNTEVAPLLSQPKIIEKYGFPNGYVNIRSEASWIA